MAEYKDTFENQETEEKNFTPVYSYTQKVNSLIAEGKIKAPKYRTLSQAQLTTYYKAKDLPEYDRMMAKLDLKNAQTNTFSENAKNTAVIEAMNILSGDRTKLAIGNILVSGDVTPLAETAATVAGFKIGEEAAKQAGRGWLAQTGAGVVGGALAGGIIGALTPTEIGKEDVSEYLTPEEIEKRTKAGKEFYEQQAVQVLKNAGYSDEEIEKLRSENGVQRFGRQLLQAGMDNLQYKASVSPHVDEKSVAATLVGGASSFGELALTGIGAKIIGGQIARSIKSSKDRWGRKADVIDRYGSIVGTKTGSIAATTEMTSDIMGEGAYSSIRKYIEDTGDSNLDYYDGDLKNVALDAYNTHLQNIIEYKLGIGKFIKNPRLATKYGEWLNGFAQEFTQGEIGDISEWIKGNQTAMGVLQNIPQNIIEGIVGAVLQGGVGTGIYTYYHNQAVDNMTDVVMAQSTPEKPINEQDARNFSEKKINELEEGIVNDMSKDIVDFVGATQYQGKIYDTVRSNLKKTVDYQRERMKDTLEGSKYDDMTEDELAQHIESTAQDMTDRIVIHALDKKIPLSEVPQLKGETIDGTYYIEGSDYAKQTENEKNQTRRAILEAVYVPENATKDAKEQATEVKEQLKIRKKPVYGKNPQTIKQLFHRKINLQFARDNGILQAFGFDESSPAARLYFSTNGGITDWNDIVQELGMEGIMESYSDSYEGQVALDDYAKKLLLDMPQTKLYQLRTGFKADEKAIQKDEEAIKRYQEDQMDSLLRENGFTENDLKDMSWEDKSKKLNELYPQDNMVYEPELTEEELAELDDLEFQVDETQKVSPLRYRDYDYIGKRIWVYDINGKKHYIEPMIVLADDTIIPLISLRDSIFPDKQVWNLYKSEGGQSLDYFRDIWSKVIRNIESIIRGKDFGKMNNGTYENLAEADNKKLLLDALEKTKAELKEDNISDADVKAQIAVVDNFISNVKDGYINPRFNEVVSLSDGTHLVTHGVSGKPETVKDFLKAGKVYNPSLYIAEKPSEYGYHSVVLFASPDILKRPEARIFDRDAYSTTISREPIKEIVVMPDEEKARMAMDDYNKYFDLEYDLYFKRSGSTLNDFALTMEEGLKNIKDDYYFNGIGIAQTFIKKYIIADALERGLLGDSKTSLYKSQNEGRSLNIGKVAKMLDVPMTDSSIASGQYIADTANKALEFIAKQENKTRDELLDSYKELAVSRKNVVKSTGEDATVENIAKAQRQHKKQSGRWQDVLNELNGGYYGNDINYELLNASGETGILTSIFTREMPFDVMVSEKQKTGKHYDSVDSRKKIRKYAIMSAMGNLLSHGKIRALFLPPHVKKTDVGAYMRAMRNDPENMISRAYAEETVAEIEKMAQRFAKIYKTLTKEEQAKLTSGKIEEGSELETKIKEALAKNGVKDDLVIEYSLNLMKEVYNHPVAYFEGKVLSDVGTNEFVGAYVNANPQWDSVADMLEEQGIKVVRGEPSDVKNATARLEEELGLDLRFQDRQRGKGGAYDSRNRSITLGSGANVTTLPHELAHYWIDKNFKWARSGNASQAWLAQWRAVEKWLGIDPEDKYLDKNASEKFARAYERFLAEEELPLVLQKSMADFRDFVLDHYDYELDDAKGLQDKLGRPIKLNEDVKAWFKKSIYESYMSPIESTIVNERLAVADKEYSEVKPQIEKEKIIEETAQNSTEIIAPTGTEIQKTANISNDVVLGKKRIIGGGEEKESQGIVGKELGKTYESTNWDVQEEMVNNYLNTVSTDEAMDALDNESYPDKIDPNFLRQAIVEKLLEEGREIEAAALIEETADDFTESAQKLQAARRINTPFTNAIRMLTIGKAMKLAEARYGKKPDAVKSLDAAINNLVAKYEPLYFKAKTDEEREIVFATMQDEAVRTIGTLDKSVEDRLDFQDIEDKEERKQASALRKKQIRRGSIKAYRSRAKRALKQALGLEPTRDQVREIKKLSVGIAKEIRDYRKAVRENTESAIDPTSILIAQNTLNEYMNKQLPPRVFTNVSDAINSFMMANMLWNPATNVFNIESTWVQMIPHMLATYINYGKGTIAWKEKIKLIKQALALQAKTGYNIFSLKDFFDKKTLWAEKYYEPKTKLGKIQAFPLTMLGLADTANKGVVFLNQADAMATKQAKEEGKKNGWNAEQITKRAKELFYQALNTDPRTITIDGLKIRQASVKEGEEATFTQMTKTAELVNKFRKLLNFGKSTGIGSLIMPFTTTIANIAEDTVLNYGLGAVRGIVNAPKAIITQFNKSATSEMKKEAWKAVAPETKNVIKNMIGIIMLLALALDADDEDYVLGYDRQTEIDKDIRQNRNAPSGYAVRIGDRWVDLDLFGIGSPWAKAYLIAKRHNFTPDGWVKGFAANIDLVPGITEIQDMYDRYSQLKTWSGDWEALSDLGSDKLSDIVERMIPAQALFNEIGNITDTSKRVSWNKWYDRAIAKIPGLRKILPERTSKQTGKVIPQTDEFWNLITGQRIKEYIEPKASDRARYEFALSGKALSYKEGNSSK